MPRCSLMSMGTPFFISKLKFPYAKYSVDKIWTKIYCHFYSRGITLRFSDETNIVIRGTLLFTLFFFRFTFYFILFSLFVFPFLLFIFLSTAFPIILCWHISRHFYPFPCELFICSVMEYIQVQSETVGKTLK